LAEAYGIDGYVVKNEKELNEVLEKELNKKWPAVIEVKIEKDEDNIFPMVPAGFSLKDTLVCREDLK
jgi:thiamine pyrophosphate-dependent acetolactate synthase large subunit-like protein